MEGVKRTLDHLRDPRLVWMRAFAGNPATFLTSSIEDFQIRLHEFHTKVHLMKIDWKWVERNTDSKEEVHTVMRSPEMVEKPDPTNTNWYDLRLTYSRTTKPPYTVDMVQFVGDKRALNPFIVNNLFRMIHTLNITYKHIGVMLDSEIFAYPSGGVRKFLSL